MKVFVRGNDDPLTIDDIKNGIFFSDFEKEVLSMFQRWVKPGFGVEYCSIEKSRMPKPAPEDGDCAMVSYLILFLGTEQNSFSVPVNAIVMSKDNPKANISEIISAARKSFSIFFDAVEMVRRQNEE